MHAFRRKFNCKDAGPRRSEREQLRRKDIPGFPSVLKGRGEKRRGMQVFARDRLLLLLYNAVQLVPLGTYRDEPDVARAAGVEHIPHTSGPPRVDELRKIDGKRTQVHEVVTAVHHHVGAVTGKRDRPRMHNRIVVVICGERVVTRPRIVVHPEVELAAVPLVERVLSVGRKIPVVVRQKRRPDGRDALRRFVLDELAVDDVPVAEREIDVAGRR